MKILEVLDAMFRMETEMAELYLWLSEVLESENRENAGLLFRLSVQERSHANLIAYQRRLVLRNRGLFADPETDLDAVEGVIDEIRSFRASNPYPMLRDALELARNLESQAAEQIHLSTTAEPSPAFQGLLDTLASDDRRHSKLLADLLAAGETRAVA